MSTRTAHQKAYRLLESVSGPMDYTMTNDFMFKAVLQRNSFVLLNLVASLLHLEPEDVKTVTVTNPIREGDAVNDKTVILDVNILFNNNTIIDLEMQVVNKGDWIDRSSYYLCRNFSNLLRGDDYDKVKTTYQIGFLDFTLFPDSPEFFAKNLLMNRKTHKIYTDKLRLYVIDLSQIDLATEEDRLYKIDEWAKLFKAKSWEDLKMLAKTNAALAEAGATIYEVSADEHLRQQLEAREDALRQERGMLRRLENAEKELNEAVAKLDVAVAERDAANSALADKDAKLDAANSALADKDAKLTEANARIAELKRQLADMKAGKEA